MLTEWDEASVLALADHLDLERRFLSGLYWFPAEGCAAAATVNLHPLEFVEPLHRDLCAMMLWWADTGRYGNFRHAEVPGQDMIHPLFLLDVLRHGGVRITPGALHDLLMSDAAPPTDRMAALLERASLRRYRLGVAMRRMRDRIERMSLGHQCD